MDGLRVASDGNVDKRRYNSELERSKICFSPFGYGEVIALGASNKYAIWAERIRCFGLTDPVIVTLAHRLRLPHLSAGAQRRMDEKTIKRLK